MRCFLCVALLACATAMPSLATAGLLDSLEGSESGLTRSMDAAQGLKGGGSLLQQLASGTFNLGSAQNVAGVLGYCQRQGYAPNAAETVKNRLMNKLGIDSKPEQSEDYNQGLSGLLKDARGGEFDLSKLKETAGKRVCSAVADKAVSSFLGG